MFVPRGYAYALLDGGKEGRIACFCVHLKSNYGATKQETRAQNAQKREIVAKQMVDLTKKKGLALLNYIKLILNIKFITQQ